MPAQLTTKAQVNGYRFLLRRLDHALIRRDVRMLHDPMRAQFRSLISGAILALLVVAGAAIMAFIKPQGSIGNASIVMGKDSGALYVVVRDQNDKTKMTLHPTLNLASARLITGSSESPTAVKDSKLSSVPRGPIKGIPGAPAALPGTKQGDRSQWTLCDNVQLSATGGAASSGGATTTAIAGDLELSDRMHKAESNAALLVRRGGKTYLIYDGKRAEVDPQNTVISRSLNLSGLQPRPISNDLLGAASEVPPIVAPVIPHAGDPGPGKLNGVKVGGVIRVAAANGSGASELYVVLSDGVQRISAFAAMVIRNSDSYGMTDIKSVPPDMLDGVPEAHALKEKDNSYQLLPVDEFPTDTPKVVRAEDSPVACISWTKASGAGRTETDATEGPSDRSSLTLLTGTRLPLPESATPVALASADSIGDRIDAVYIPPATGEFVIVTGPESGSLRRDSMFYVADNGIRYGIPDIKTAQILGLGSTPHLAPSSIIGELVAGPTLSVTSALKERDVLPPLPDPAAG